MSGTDAQMTRMAYMRRLCGLVFPYWRTRDSIVSWKLLFVIVLFSGSAVFLAKQFNAWYNDFYNALQELDVNCFWSQMIIFAVMAAFHVFISVTNAYCKQNLMIEWRHWMSSHFMDRWLADGVFYRMNFTQGKTDNPDQRIAEDLNEFVSLTFMLTVGILTDIAMLATFFMVLWGLSKATVFAVGDFEMSLPDGYLCYLAVTYAAIGTLLTFIIGRPLIKLNFRQQRLEADFRYSLVRVRENAESIAIYGGAKEEGKYLEERFVGVVKNVFMTMKRSMYLGFFTFSYHQASVLFPFIVASPMYFAKTITLGALIQISSAFGHVQDSLSTLIDSFTSIARWKSVVDRLVQYTDNMDQATKIGSLPAARDGSEFGVADLCVARPDGEKLLINGAWTLGPGDAMLVRGPSGCGKSTLFRALAGLWPYASGSVSYPEGQALFLSQKPYLPLGTLRRAVCYPDAPLPDHVILPYLRLAGLDNLASSLDVDAPWSQILSLGEQQRIAFVRALIVRPQVLFLDEASSALDEEIEEVLYAELRRVLRNSIIVSVGHRSSLKRFHDCYLEWREDLAWELVPGEQFIEDGECISESCVRVPAVDDNETLLDRFRRAYARPGEAVAKRFGEKIKEKLSFWKKGKS